jgi:glycosyltransferase involved in cell wall biosynthesis
VSAALSRLEPARLLFIVNSLAVGGAERQLVTLLNHLDQRRFRLHLAYLKSAAGLRPQLREECLEEILACDARHFLDRRVIARLRALCAARRIDAIICVNPYSMLYGHLARAANPGVRLATVFHSTLLHSPKEKAQMLLYRRLFRRCDLLLYVCESQRRYWRAQGLQPAADEVVYNGIDTDWYRDPRPPAERLAFRRSLGVQDEDYLIGLCAVLRPEKAHGDLLLALERLHARGLRAKALFIGDGPERAVIERTVARLGLAAHVRITGFTADVRPFIGACDAMTLVSHAVETFSVAALESMSLGKPLVMSDLGGAGEQVSPGEQGYLYPPGDIEALTHYLTALGSPALRARLGEAAARRVRERFTVQSMTERFTDCIERLLPSRPTAPGPARGSALNPSRY